MARAALNDMVAFSAVARERSFTRAAKKLGVSQSALSQTLKKLEEELGVQLLVRTTRSVAPTAIGERLLQKIGPHLEGIESELAAVAELRDRPAGTIRISASDLAINELLLPKLSGFLQDYPDVKIEMVIDYGLVDIVAQRFDAGVRYGEILARDMIAVRIGPDARMVAVGTPDYFARHPKPETPGDLAGHNCINMRQQGSGGLYAWELQRKDQPEIRVQVEGQLTFNGIYSCLQAAVSGLGLAFVPENIAAPYLEDGRLEIVLDDWSLPFPGFYLYYPAITQPSPAFSLFVEALRYRWD
ncbi:MAG TPA: LysR family transcriptional regulator [Hyphomonas sp.]|nr:LysR family transcriptional regulator [Hyphomonas sp.]HRX75113.1 LysR family transcriptional regulator [Hyphomonas sp.]